MPGQTVSVCGIMVVALEAFCLMMFQMLCGKKKKAPSNFSIKRGSILILDTSRLAAYCASRKEKKAMKLPRNSLNWCVLVVCLTLLIFTYLTQSRLCEIRLKDGNREVAARLAYESNGK